MKKKVGNIVLVGTSHVSDDSVEEVREVINQEDPDIIAVELDIERYKSIKSNDKPSISFLSLQNFSHVLLSLLQKVMGGIVNVKPGSDMRKAIELSEKKNIRLELIDRKGLKTLRKLNSSFSTVEKAKLSLYSIFSFFILILFESIYRITGKDKYSIKLAMEEEIDIKDEEDIDKKMKKLKQNPKIYNLMIRERDIIMSLKLSRHLNKDKKVVAVVGAGHISGIEKRLKGIQESLIIKNELDNMN